MAAVADHLITVRCPDFSNSFSYTLFLRNRTECYTDLKLSSKTDLNCYKTMT